METKNSNSERRIDLTTKGVAYQKTATHVIKLSREELSLEKLHEKYKQRLDEELKTQKKDFITDFLTFLGIFVSFITYASVEIQILRYVNDVYVLIGLSIFFLGAILLFSITLNSIAKGKVPYSDFFSPIYIILYCLFLASFYFFHIHFKMIESQNKPNEIQRGVLPQKRDTL